MPAPRTAASFVASGGARRNPARAGDEVETGAPADQHQVVVPGAGNGDRGLVGGARRVVRSLAVRHGNDPVPLVVKDRGQKWVIETGARKGSVLFLGVPVSGAAGVTPARGVSVWNRHDQDSDFAAGAVHT